MAINKCKPKGEPEQRQQPLRSLLIQTINPPTILPQKRELRTSQRKISQPSRETDGVQEGPEPKSLQKKERKDRRNRDPNRKALKTVRVPQRQMKNGPNSSTGKRASPGKEKVRNK